MTIGGLANRNIRNKPQRAYGMIALTAMICIVLFISSFIILSLKNGVVSLSNRMGADVIVVPEGYDSKVTGAILRGEPNTFFLHEDVLERVRAVEGVESATPQLFIATLSAGCCSFPIQVIGIDTESDFVVLPWLKAQAQLPLEEDRVIVGHNIVGNYNEEVKFFNRSFAIHGRLAETGMGFDNSVFMSLEGARALAKEFEKLIGIEHVDMDASYSSVMVKIRPGADSRAVRDAIKVEFRNEPAERRVYALASKQMMSDVSSNMNGFLLYLYVQILLIWLLAFTVLTIVYSFSVKERKREIGALRIMGANRRQVRNILLLEALKINGRGAVVGTIFGAAGAFLFSRAIGAWIDMPFLSPGLPVFALLGLGVCLLGALLGPLSAFFSIRKMLRTDTMKLMREND